MMTFWAWVCPSTGQLHSQRYSNSCYRFLNVHNLGVRIAFYLQIYLSGVLALLPHADFSASAWGVSATFWALFVAALVSWLQDTLTLFQAVIGVYLLFLHALASTLCIAPSYGNLRGLRPPTLPFVVVSVVLSNVAVAIMGILVGLRGRRIGPSRECNEVMKLQILFLRFTPAEKDGRSFILAFSIAYLVIFMAFTIFQLAIWTHRKGWKDGEMTPDCLVITLDHFKENVRRPGDILYLRTNMFLRHRLWLATLTMETVWMCSMFNIEYTLYLNGIQGTSTTGFGQVGTSHRSYGFLLWKVSSACFLTDTCYLHTGSTARSHSPLDCRMESQDENKTTHELKERSSLSSIHFSDWERRRRYLCSFHPVLSV